MAEKKPVKKPAVAAPAKKAKPVAAKPAAKAKPVAAKPAAKAKPVAAKPAAKAKPAAAPQKKPTQSVPPPAAMRKVIGPTARACPLVLDGEVDALDFTEVDCLTCGEFDCKFCESQPGSGSLRSRLFGGSDEGDDDADDDLDLDFGEGEESLDGAEEESEGEEEL